MDGGACARPPEEIEGPYRDLCLSRGDVERFVASLHDGLARDDRTKVAALVRYPLRVHTAHCLKHIAASADLLVHYNEIFAATLKNDILATRPPLFVRDRSLMLASGGRLWAWVDDVHRILLGGVFLGERDLPGVPCADRVFEPLPGSVWGTWTVSSVRAGPLEQLTSFPWADWKRLTISLDRASRTLTSALGDLRRECTVLWLARDTSSELADPNAVRPCTAFESFWGLRDRERSRLLQVSCPGAASTATPTPLTNVPSEVIVLDDSTMVIRLGCEGIAILKKQVGRPAETARRIVQRGAVCGTPDVDCALGARCVAVSANPLTERCKSLDEAAE
ncbi:Hypothetical protein A7982_11598 [Minicystis rosea]|nr:Hypothetical protein A7982_11598 [Minicystis rosea]